MCHSHISHFHGFTRFYTLIYLSFYQSTRPVYFCCCFCLEQPRGRVAKHKRTAVWRHWRSLWLWWQMRWKVRNLEYLVEIFSSKNGVVCGTGARRNRHIWVDQSHCRETVQVRALSFLQWCLLHPELHGIFCRSRLVDWNCTDQCSAFTSGWICPRLGWLFLKHKQNHAWMTKIFIYANIFILWQHFVSWHIRLVHKRQFCSQDKILNERLRKLNFQGKSYPCWRIYWAHKQACIGFQVLQSSFSKHIAHASATC